MKCPYCNKEIKKGTKKCPNCKAEIIVKKEEIKED